MSSDPPGPLRFPAGGGAAARLILARDRAGHGPGPPAGWPDTPKLAIGLILDSPESTIPAWGRDDLVFFNDACAPMLAPRVARATGARFDAVRGDGMDQARPIIDEAFAGRSMR